MALWNFLVWNPWFLLGGILFCALAWLARRDIWERADDGTTVPIKGRF